MYSIFTSTVQAVGVIGPKLSGSNFLVQELGS
jgi:hypothetical protein